ARRQVDERRAQLAAGEGEMGEAADRVVAAHGRAQHGAGVEPVDVFAQVKPAGDLLDGAGGDDAAALDQHEVAGEAQHLLDRVGDVEDGNAELRGQALDE